MSNPMTNTDAFKLTDADFEGELLINANTAPLEDIIKKLVRSRKEVDILIRAYKDEVANLIEEAPESSEKIKEICGRLYISKLL